MNLTALRALLPVAALAGLAACATPSPTPAAGASTTPPATAAPASPATPTAVNASPTRGAPPGTTRAACPVSAATLQGASGLDRSTHRIDPDHIACARQWATAGVLAVDPGMQGDGVLLFKHSDGRWQKVGEGSALECTPFGIPPEIGDQVGCRDH
ncbi:hypothetical protein GAR06_03472 [Micromonospora saelicesensis]|uniref:hypothetical protein n=1 Tax=Micromonospora saelicesensis TaxID=285676 RepID=UPI000DC29528|nr:hypothetical protein [Micromonospora saelicesensis]RAO45281.1 hypothetical protein GAR06_03472 [Micromonospora saelicesensis]